MDEKEYQAKLADFIKRYDAAMQAPQREKDAYDREFNEFIVFECNASQSKRALDLLALHVSNIDLGIT